MANQVRVFISHHHSAFEDAFTSRLVSDLETAGADVWVDDVRITSDDFIQKINEGLVGRHWLVFVMTPDALRSPWVQTEVNAGLNQVRKGRMLGVIPIMAMPCDDADIPPLLDTLHRYDATRAYEGARDGLLRALGLISPEKPESPPAPAMQPSKVSVRDSAEEFERVDHYAAAELDSWETSQVLEVGIETEPPSLVEWLRRGRACLESKRFEDAVADYEEALAIDGNSPLAWSGKAIALKRLGRDREAGHAAQCARLGAILTRRRAEVN